MSTNTVSAFTIRRNLGKYLDLAGYKQVSTIIEKNGEPLAAIVPISVLDESEQRRKDFFDAIRTIQTSINLSPEAADEQANQLVEIVRTRKNK